MKHISSLTLYLQKVGNVADPYHFDTDPDPGCAKIRYGSGSRLNFDSDLDLGKNDTDPGKKKIQYRYHP